VSARPVLELDDPIEGSAKRTSDAVAPSQAGPGARGDRAATDAGAADQAPRPARRRAGDPPDPS
jgi:hypothetical protein